MVFGVGEQHGQLAGDVLHVMHNEREALGVVVQLPAFGQCAYRLALGEAAGHLAADDSEQVGDFQVQLQRRTWRGEEDETQ